MRAFGYVLVFLISITFISCSPDGNGGRTIVISVASDYSDTHLASPLFNTVNDQAAFIQQVYAMDEKAEVHMFRIENMRYIKSDNPVFGNPMESIYVHYMKSENEIGRSMTMKIPLLSSEESYWDMNDVLFLLGNIRTEDEDILIFHYSGHGDKDGTLYAGEDLMPIKRSEIEYLMSDEYRKGIKLMILDSCYSGTFIQDSSLTDGTLFSEDEPSELLLSSPFISLWNALSESGRKSTSSYVLCSSHKAQVSYEGYSFGEKDQRYFGLFSYYLLKAMGYDFSSYRGKRRNTITLYGLYNDIWKDMDEDIIATETPRVTLSEFDAVIFR